MTRKVYVVDAIRTPIGKFGRTLARFSAVELGSMVIKSIVDRNNLDPNDVDIVVFGHVIRAGTGMDTARQASIKAGIPEHVDAMTVDMVCASGMAGIITGASMIKAGDVDIAIVGGMESMSRTPFIIPWEYRWGVKLLYGRETPILDALVYEGLTDPFNGMIMAQEADMLAKEHGVTRSELEEVALESHKKAYRATVDGIFKKEIHPVEVDGQVILDNDEGIRGDTTIDKMARLPPIFPGGLHTAATSSQISDGASALLLVSEDALSKYGWKPRASIKGYSWGGLETWKFPAAPIYAVRKLLDKHGLSIDVIDVFENNEAFAVSTIVYERLLDIPRKKINVFGGAIALGHPLGASGARITTTLLNAMEHLSANLGVASICHGMGGATALLLEREK